MYENNKSAAQAIKDQISAELGVELMYINLALVSAQNRQRFYAFNWSIEQPQDRGILLRDILETTVSEKGYNLAPPIPINETNGKAYAIKAQYWKSVAANFISRDHFPATAVAQPIRIGTIENAAQNKLHDSKQYIIQCGDAFALRNNDWNLENLRLVKERLLKQLTEAHNEYRQRAAGY